MAIRILAVALLLCWIVTQYLLGLSGAIEENREIRYMSIITTLFLSVVTSYILLCG